MYSVVGWTAVSSLHWKCLVYFFRCWMVYWVVLWKGNFLLIIQRVFYFNTVILSFQLNNYFMQISKYGVICIINDCKEFWPCYSYNAHNITSFRYWFPSSRKVGTCCKLIIKGILDAIAFLWLIDYKAFSAMTQKICLKFSPLVTIMIIVSLWLWFRIGRCNACYAELQIIMQNLIPLMR